MNIYIKGTDRVAWTASTIRGFDSTRRATSSQITSACKSANARAANMGLETRYVTGP